MKTLESVDCGQLMWKQTGFGARDFELWSGDDLVGVLYWPKLLSDRAVGEYADDKWYLDRKGFFRRRVVVIEAESGTEVASFEPNWLGDGDLCLSDGRVFRWHKTKVFREFWALADEHNNVLFEIRAGMRWFKHEADVVLQIDPESLPGLPLLIFIGWYLGYMQTQDAAAAIAGAT